MNTTVSLGADCTVGQWVRRHPSTSRVFAKHGIDYCCGGGVALTQACERKQITLSDIEQELQRAIADPASQPSVDLESMSMAEVCDLIVREHHDALREELPRLTAMVDKVVSVHGAHFPWLAAVQTAFNALRDELIPHMMKEELILFPAIKKIESTQSLPLFPFGSINNPLSCMEHEHEDAGVLLAEIRQQTSDFAIPAEACNTFRAMLDGLRELELDMHTHVHRENNVLFPRVRDLVQELEQA